MPGDEEETEAQPQKPPAPPAGGAPPPAPPAAPRAPAPPPDDETDADRARAANIRERERRRALRDAYGTDDPDEIDRIKRERAEKDASYKKTEEELARLRQKDADAERAKMSEVERLTADLNAEREKNKALEAKLAGLQTEVLHERQVGAVRSAAAQFRIKAKPVVMRAVVAAFGEHYLGLTAAEKKRYAVPAEAQRMLTRWMKKFAEENPELVDAAAATPEPKKEAPPARPPAVRQPLGAPRRPAPPPQNQSRPPANRPPHEDENGKTTLPGRPNSMTAEELKRFKQKQGLKAS